MTNPTPEKFFSAFLPVTLIALGSIMLLSWNLVIVISQHSNGLRISAQQDLQLEQAAQAEVKLKQMMTELVDLSKDDTDAATIVKRYGIVFNNPAGKVPVQEAKPAVKEPADK
ncbi:MAG: hypothetical protein WCL49_05470 [bacterium]